MPRGKNKKPRAERRAQQKQRSEREAYEMQILDDVRCPARTVARAVETFEDIATTTVDAFTFLNTADYVWRDDPAEAELHGALTELRTVLAENLERLLAVSRRLESLAETEREHEDLTREEVAARLEPMFQEQEAERRDEGPPEG